MNPPPEWFVGGPLHGATNLRPNRDISMFSVLTASIFATVIHFKTKNRGAGNPLFPQWMKAIPISHLELVHHLAKGRSDRRFPSLWRFEGHFEFGKLFSQRSGFCFTWNKIALVSLLSLSHAIKKEAPPSGSEGGDLQ